MTGNGLQRARATFESFPRPFWTLVLGTFIDRLGGHMLFPFFALYLTGRFGVGMTDVAFLFATWSVVSVVGATAGGALADRFGRKGMVVFGLAASGASSLLLAAANSMAAFFLVAIVVGVVAEAGWPAQEAMVADLLPEEKRADGYGILRVAFNLSVVIAPVLGGLLAARSYTLLFVADAVTSGITALLVFFFIGETKPSVGGEQAESLVASFRGYGVPLRDRFFLGLLFGTALLGIVYIQLNSSLGVFLRDVYQVPPQGYGYLLSLNALMVVLMQFWITRRISGSPQFLMLALGATLTALGFGLYGFVSAYGWFMVAMAVLTVGEMVMVPVGQALVARLAPEDMRGRYMAVFGYSWTVAGIVGPMMAGLLLDSGHPTWLWYVCLAIGLAAAATYLALDGVERRRQRLATAPVLSGGSES
ncbi:MAG TPA: MFS transporter [Anaerolineales bacterium]|nr:MFS transporter [Anaerolineales bacterium]